MTKPTKPVIVWAVKDGKPGHENQVMGLIDALAEQVTVDMHVAQPMSLLCALIALLFKRLPVNRELPQPDFVIGAGHATHWTLLAARRVTGSKAIVLMKPSLPCRWFDLCVVPAHDVPEPGDQVFETQGVLNRMRPGAMKDPRQGLILVGGESRHGVWDNADVIRQVKTIVQQDSQVNWTLTTSRRTPKSFLAEMNLSASNLTVVPVEQTPSGWLQNRLAETAWAWVTEDSVSMVYEALTAGAAVGVLEIKRKKDSRVTRGIQQLIQQGRVKPFSAWQSKPRLALPREPFNEAARCAQEIVRRWPIGV